MAEEIETKAESKEATARGMWSDIQVPSLHELARAAKEREKEKEAKQRQKLDELKVEIIEEKVPQKIKLEVYTVERKSNFVPVFLILTILAIALVAGYYAYFALKAKPTTTAATAAPPELPEETPEEEIQKLKQTLREGLKE